MRRVIERFAMRRCDRRVFVLERGWKCSRWDRWTHPEHRTPGPVTLARAVSLARRTAHVGMLTESPRALR